jgi:heptosyltransferase I
MVFMPRICFARVDRIGDLVLTLPCQSAWLRLRPEDHIQWMIPENLEFIAKNAVPPLNSIFLKSSENFIFKIRAAFSLSKKLRLQNFDEIVFFHTPWWVAMAAFLSGIPKRTGVASQWFSWLFFNRRLRQRRSLAEKNEAFYNLDLVCFTLGLPDAKSLLLIPARLTADKNIMMKWAQNLKGQGIDLGRMVVIHPGMGGSARNWPPNFYKTLAEDLRKDNVSVIVTGTKMDEDFINKTEILEVSGVVSLANLLSSQDLLSVLSLSKCVVAPSTGVVHLAASLGVPTVGIYSPVRVQAPKRWAPLGPRVQVLLPNVECPATFKCLGPSCQFYDCMEQITVESLKGCVMDKL